MSDPRNPSLAELEVRDPVGNPVALRSLWASRPVLLVMVRHFG